MTQMTFLAFVIFFLPIAAQAGPAQPTAEPAGVRELQDKPEEFVGRRVEVTGRLETRGRNYFRDPDFVLTDSRGAEIDVDPWLPLETPPAPPGRRNGRKPPTMSDLVGKSVKVSGEMVPGPEDSSSPTLDPGGRRAPARMDPRYILRPTNWKIVR